MQKEVLVKKRKSKKIILYPKIQTIFCIISIIFILGCCVFYGNRLIKYYKIYNPKSETGENLTLLATKITNGSEIVFEGDGLYNNNGSFVYKGVDVDNYLLFSNMLFRIVRINNDKTIDIVLDDYINKLKWSDEITSYDDSYINKYLTDNFLSSVDLNLLAGTKICLDKTYELSEIKCDNVLNNSYVRLLGITDFLNSMNDSKTYINTDTNLWLYNYGEKNVWHTNGSFVANQDPSKIYAIKPVLTLKNSTVLLKGDGTVNNPYQIDNNEIGVGTYLDINDDIYIIYYEGKDYYKIQSNRVITEKQIFDNKSNEYLESSLKKYIENNYQDKIDEKILKDIDWGSYTGSVGILNNLDLKFNSSLNDYFLIDKLDKNICIYNANYLSSEINKKRNVRLAYSILKDLKITSGNGSKLAPYIVEGLDA